MHRGRCVAAWKHISKAQQYLNLPYHGEHVLPLESNAKSSALIGNCAMIVYDPQAASLFRDTVKLPVRSTLQRALLAAQKCVPLKGEVAVMLTDDKGIRKLNRTFRGKNKPTDVLSFPAADPQLGIAGDLAISVETAARQAAAEGHPLRIELRILILHGVLHLAGYDHETDSGQMARLECNLRRKLRLPQGLIERTTSTHAHNGKAR